MYNTYKYLLQLNFSIQFIHHFYSFFVDEYILQFEAKYYVTRKVATSNWMAQLPETILDCVNRFIIANFTSVFLIQFADFHIAHCL